MLEKAEVVFTPNQNGYEVQRGPVGGEDVTMDAMTIDEIQRFHDDYVNLINQYQENMNSSNAALAQLFLNNEDLVLEVVRVVKRHAERPYQGRAAEGNGVIIDILTPQDFGMTSWFQNIAATGEVPYIQSSSTPGNPMTIHENAGFVIFGYTNLLPTPRSQAIKYQKQTRTIPYKQLPFYLFNIVPEQTPIQVLPESDILATVYYSDTGLDGLVPLGVKAVTADRVSDPLTSAIEA